MPLHAIAKEALIDQATGNFSIAAQRADHDAVLDALMMPGTPLQSITRKGTVMMHPTYAMISAAAITVMMTAAPASANTLKSSVAFNTGIGEKTASQPADGVEDAYQITMKGGDLDGCTVDVVEALRPREEGAWGFFDIQGDVTCDRGGFSYTSAGAWDGNGFHASGMIEDGSGSGEFEGVSGRVAQLNGGGASAGDGTTDISYDLLFDTAEG
jgi:hypothetical protein